MNEDSCYCRDDCFIVADGLGGHENGEIASAQAVNYISDNFSGMLDGDGVSRLLAGADEAVRSGGEGGKSTLAALFISENTVRYANVGDSRMYYFRQGKILARTKDHSVCQASVEMGELDPGDVRGSDDRSGLFKVLGASQPLKVPKPYEPIGIQDGDAFLLCSDGFWEYVYEMEMQADLLKSRNAAEWLRHMVKRLLLRSENSGDNYTAVCGIIHAPEFSPAEKRRICSPVLIAGLAVSLAAFGVFTAINLCDFGRGGADPVIMETQEPAETADGLAASTADSETATTESAAQTPETATAESAAQTPETATVESAAQPPETATAESAAQTLENATAESAAQPPETATAESAAQTPETATAESAAQTPETATAESAAQTPETTPAETAAQTPETATAETAEQTEEIATAEAIRETTSDKTTNEAQFQNTSDTEVGTND